MIQEVPASGLREYIVGLAQCHGVTYAKTPADELAEVMTRLSDDYVVMDDVEDLLVALKRAEVISAETMVALLGRYLSEREHY